MGKKNNLSFCNLLHPGVFYLIRANKDVVDHYNAVIANILNLTREKRFGRILKITVKTWEPLIGLEHLIKVLSGACWA